MVVLGHGSLRELRCERKLPWELLPRIRTSAIMEWDLEGLAWIKLEEIENEFES